MDYHAVLENHGEGKVFVNFYPDKDRSKMQKTSLTRVNFSDERRLGELVHEFHMALKCKSIKNEEQRIGLEYQSPVDGVDVFHAFVKYFVRLSKENKGKTLWIDC
jgi:hypothetical protein